MNIKKLAMVILAVCTLSVCSVSPDFSADAAETRYGDLLYEVVDGCAEITGCSEDAFEVEIPSEINGVPVVRIGDNAFNSCYDLISVTIPDSVTSLGNWAFYSCFALESINIPDSVTEIGDMAFYDCESISQITIPASVETLGSGTFGMCTGLKSIDAAPESPYFYSEDGILFSNDRTSIFCVPAGKLLTEYTIPDNVAKIENYAFSYCKKLTAVNIPDSVKSIGSYAFYQCKSLASITIPEGITTISSRTFSDCTNLKSVNIPASVSSIGKSAFYCCSSLEHIDLPESLSEIADYTFYYCVNLNGITIPQRVQKIGIYAFYQCRKLGSVVLPKNVNSIGESAFYIQNMESITIENPKCEIYDHMNTINFGYDSENNVFYGSIYGYDSSTAEDYAELYGRNFVSMGKAPKVIYGDADDSGEVTLADAVAVVSYIADSDRYPLGSYEAADVCNNGDGINTSDAISIQNFLLGNIKFLPESYIIKK